MKNFFKNLFNTGYKYHKDAVIIACYYNPENNPYRLKNFNEWYESIKHLNHKIIELSINKAPFQLPLNSNILRLSSKNNLWYKEQLLNKVIEQLVLENKYKYVFWIDCDVLLTNKNWLVDSVKEFEKGTTILQPFSHCKHLTLESTYKDISAVDKAHLQFEEAYPVKKLAKEKLIWNSAAYVYNTNKVFSTSQNYDLHGHVGFVWGATLESLKKQPLFEKALTGGADHIMYHASIGEFDQKDILDVYNANIKEVLEFMYKWYDVHKGKLSYVKGDLFHLYHGDLKKRDYYNRIKKFTPHTKNINKKDDNGLYIPTVEAESTYNEYYKEREAIESWETIVNLIEAIPEQKELEFEGGDFAGGSAEGSYETFS